MARNKFMGKHISRSLGAIKELDLELGEMEWGEYMWLKVTLDIKKPLLRKKKLSIGIMEPVWVSFSYERFLNFCLYCGNIGYGQQDYQKWKV